MVGQEFPDDILFRELIDSCGEEVVLGAKVVIEQPVRDFGLFSDLLHSGAFNTVFKEEANRHLYKSAFSFFGA